MVGVERVAVGVGEEHVGCELADAIGDRDECFGVDLERVVAEVEALELGTDGRRSPLGLAVADLLHALDRLPRFLPQLAGLPPLAVREGEDARATRRSRS